MLTPEELATIRRRALLAQHLGSSDDQAAATLAADVLLLLEELEIKNVTLGHLVHGTAAPLHGSPASPTGKAAPRTGDGC
jgi:hypothetical protein